LLEVVQVEEFLILAVGVQEDIETLMLLKLQVEVVLLKLL
jgi:hypothetical protein